jgi:hypothetical protein
MMLGTEVETMKPAAVRLIATYAGHDPSSGQVRLWYSREAGRGFPADSLR